MQRSGCAGADERQGNLCLNHTGQILLGFFRRFLHSLQRHPILLQIDAVFFSELICHPVDDYVIEIIAA